MGEEDIQHVLPERDEDAVSLSPSFLTFD